VTKLPFSQGFDLWRIEPVAYFSAFVETDAYFKGGEFDPIDPNGWTGRVERRVVRILHSHCYVGTNGSKIAVDWWSNEWELGRWWVDDDRPLFLSA
jgi:hypothetical protein